VSETLAGETAAPAGVPDLTAAPLGGGMRGVARSAWFGLWAQAVDKLTPVALVLYLARRLPAEGFGVYAFLLAYLAFFQVLSDYSIDTVLVRKLSGKDVDRARVLSAGLALKLGIGLVSAVVAAAAAGVVSGGRVPFDLALAAALTLPAGLAGAYRAYFRATLEIRSVFLLNLARALLLLVAVVGMVAIGGGLRGIFLAMAAASLVWFVIVARLLRHRVPQGFKVDVETWRELLRGALPLFLNALAMTLSLRIGQILLMSLRGPVEVGLLAAASRVSEAFSIVTEALMNTVYPLLAGQFQRESAELMRTAERSARYLVVCTGIPVILCAVDSTTIVQVLFGPSFTASARLLEVLVFTALLGASGTVILNLLVATHHEKPLYRNTLLFAAINVAASALLIRLQGDLGAAVALLATSAASQIALASWPSTSRYVRPILFAVARVFAAAIFAVAVGRSSGLAGLPATLLGLVIYVVTLIAIGVLNRDEVAFVRAVVATATRARP
jgi:PST family polysaccharide transporter